MILRDYQNECHEEIASRGPGNWLIQMATGLGKTATFTQLPVNKRTLILAHREELVMQPRGYYNIPVGIEMAKHQSNGEKVVCASVQTMIKRKIKFRPDEFDTIIIDEAHHYPSHTYREVIEYFKPQLRLGFTATPNRADDIGLDMLFDEIIFSRDIRFGIQNKYLSNLKCLRADFDYDLSSITTRMGDFAIGELERQMSSQGAIQATKKALDEYGKLPALIFCVTVAHAEEMAKAIPGAVAISGKTKNRADILARFNRGEIPVLTTVQVLTEGVDLPIAVTGVMARPTKSTVLYTQMVGRLLRLHENKEEAILIDGVGNVGNHDICSAPTLLGLDLDEVPKSAQIELIGDLLDDLPELVKEKSECIETWVKNIKLVDIFAKKNNLKTYGINFIKHPDGSLICAMPNKRWVGITPIDQVGKCHIITSKQKVSQLLPAQEAMDHIIKLLNKIAASDKRIWDVRAVKRWGKEQMSDKQRGFIISLIKKLGHSERLPKMLTKQDASCIIGRLSNPCDSFNTSTTMDTPWIERINWQVT